MTTGYQRSKLAEIKRKEIANKVIKILHEHKEGLTSVQITILMGDGMPRDLLRQLLKEGLVKQKKGLLSDGRLAVLYALCKDPKANS